MNIIRFDLLIDGADYLHSELHVRCNGIDFKAERHHQRDEVAIAGWDGDMDKLRAIIKADLRDEVMRKVARNVFAEYEAA